MLRNKYFKLRGAAFELVFILFQCRCLHRFRPPIVVKESTITRDVSPFTPRQILRQRIIFLNNRLI